MTQPLRVQAHWDEVAGSITGHIEGVPEITVTSSGPATEAFERVVKQVQDNLHLSDRPVVIDYIPDAPPIAVP